MSAGSPSKLSLSCHLFSLNHVLPLQPHHVLSLTALFNTPSQFGVAFTTMGW